MGSVTKSLKCKDPVPSKNPGDIRNFLRSHSIDSKRAADTAAAVAGIAEHLERDFGNVPEVSIESVNNAVKVEIRFSAGVLKVDRDGGLTAPEWLTGLIKNLDRIFIGRDHKTGILQLMEYPRDKGHEGEVWYMRIAPALRKTVRFGKSGSEGLTVLEDIETGKVLGLNSADGMMVSEMDGRRTLRELYLEVIDRYGLVAPEAVKDLYLALERNGMLEACDLAVPVERPGRIRRLFEEGIVFRRANEILDVLRRRLGVLAGSTGALLLFLSGSSGLVAALMDGRVLLEVIRSAGPYALHHPWMLVGLSVFTFLSTLAHELGHGLACRQYGGRVDRMGMMLYLVTLLFYCDVSSAWGMKSRRKRVGVSLAGPLVTFGVMGLCLWVSRVAGMNTGTGIFFAAAAAVEALVLLMNLNPLLRMDAYYVLEDVLNVKNLRRKSLEFWKGLLQGKIPETVRREKYLYSIYGLLGGACTLAFLVLPLYYYGSELIRHHGSEGKLFLAGLMVLLVVVRSGMGLIGMLTARTHWIREIRI